MNGNFRVGRLVHLPVVHNMHQLVFGPTQALGATNAQNIENHHFSVNFSKYALFIKFNRFKMT
jgi:hypothetical protein